MSTATPLTASAPAVARRAPRSVVISAWAVPVMVLGQFALLAVIPLALLIRSILRDAGLRHLRVPTLLLSASWTVPLAVWLLHPDRPQSLSKDISLLSVALIVVASAVMLLSLRRRR